MKMKPGDWIDAREIDSPETLEAVREAVREMGWDVSLCYGTWDRAAREEAKGLELDGDGDLLWVHYAEDCAGRQIHVSDLIRPEPKGHPAAAILREIAEVADENPTFWHEFVEWQLDPTDASEEMVLGFVNPHVLLKAALLNPDNIRRKPRTKRIGSYDVPIPEREAPAARAAYWVASAESKHYRFSTTWTGGPLDNERLYRGLIHLDPESAATHGRALASLMQEVEE